MIKRMVTWHQYWGLIDKVRYEQTEPDILLGSSQSPLTGPYLVSLEKVSVSDQQQNETKPFCLRSKFLLFSVKANLDFEITTVEIRWKSSEIQSVQKSTPVSQRIKQ